MPEDKKKSPPHITFYKNVEEVPSRRRGKYAEIAEELEKQVPKGAFISAAEFAKAIAEATESPIAKVRGSVWARLTKNGKWAKKGGGVFQRK